MKDAKTGTAAKCTSVKMSGTLESGKGLADKGTGEVTSASFTG